MINNFQLIQITADAATGISTWNREKARNKYLYFLQILQQYFTMLPTREQFFLNEWIYNILAIAERPDFSF